MKEIINTKRSRKVLIAGLTSTALILSLAALSLPSNAPAQALKKASPSQKASVAAPSVANPAPPADACENMQVLVLLDRSGSVTNEGSATVQKYKDQVKKVWNTLHNISVTYGGYASGYLWAFAGRTADQMPRLLAKDNNKDGVLNDEDRNLNNLDVLSGYEAMTQDIYFRNDNSPMYPSNQLAGYGYNPKNEDTRYFTKANYTNWHESFLMAQSTIATANAPGNALRDYSMVIIVTDGDPTVDDGANHTWDTFAKNKKIDENFDGSVNTSSHATRTKAVVDALRSGYNVKTPSQTFTPVQVHGVLIGGNSSSQTRMTNTYGTGNWFASSNFDTTLGAQLLSIVSQTCPPDPSLTSSLSAEVVSAPSSTIEDSDVTYLVDVTNNGSAVLEEVTVSNGTVVDMPKDPTYTSAGLLSPGKKRRFTISLHIGGGSTSANVSLPYSAHVAEDPSMMAPNQQMDLSGTLSANLTVSLVPRPS